MFPFGKFVPGVTCMLFFFSFLPFLAKVCLVSVKQGNFIYMPVLSTICVAAVCAQESIPANTKHCNGVFGMSKMVYGLWMFPGRSCNFMCWQGRQYFSHDSMLYYMVSLS